MAEKEAIEIIQNEKRCVLKNIAGCDRKCADCNLVMDDNKICDGYDTAIKALEEIQQYREIGTVEECRAAMEKQVPKKPVKRSFIIPYEGIDVCPNCKEPISKKEHHCKCGQTIDWREEE